MKKKITETVINFFDYFHKKKIMKFLLSQKFKIDIIYDIGAHKGESINLFLKYLKPNIIYSFEALENNYNVLLENIKSIKTPTKINVYNIALGEREKIDEINILNETSSTTLKGINQSSNYYKKKNFFFNLTKNIIKKKIKVTTLDKVIDDKSIEIADFCKIDTEGSEFDILVGLENKISNIKIILFEHHFDNMIIKNYNLSDIHDLLTNKNFSKIFKIKMPFRKTFEYIYINRNFLNLN